MASTALHVDVSQGIGSPDLEVCGAAAINAGFDGLELLAPTDCHNRLYDLQIGGPERRVEARSKAPVLALAARLAHIGIEDAAEVVRRLLGVAANAGAACLNLTPPLLAASANRAGATGFIRYQESLNYTYRLLRRLRHDAESSGVTVTVPGAGDGCFLSPVELRELIDAVNSWAVGVCVDTRVVERVGDPVDWLLTLRRRVHAVRVWFDESTHPPSEPTVTGTGAGDGADAIDGLRKALKEIQYDRLITAAGPGPRSELAPSALRARLAALL